MQPLYKYVEKILETLLGNAKCPFCNSEKFIVNLEVIAEVELAFNQQYSRDEIAAILKCNLIACKECREILVSERTYVTGGEKKSS